MVEFKGQMESLKLSHKMSPIENPKAPSVGSHGLKFRLSEGGCFLDDVGQGAWIPRRSGEAHLALLDDPGHFTRRDAQDRRTVAGQRLQLAGDSDAEQVLIGQ